MTSHNMNDTTFYYITCFLYVYRLISFVFLKINPARLGKDENAVGNLTSLIEFLDEALDSIVNSSDNCPL